MKETATWTSHRVLIANTLAFTVCFSAWMLNGVLVTFLAANEVFKWGPVEIGWLMGIPVLSGSIFRLPAGILTDKYGGRSVFTALLLLCAVPMYLLSHADSLLTFALYSFGFGLAGTSFSIGIAFTSVWYPRSNQGTALGIFGAGNAGAALTTLVAPTLLGAFIGGGANLDGWRLLPKVYAAMLVIMGLTFFVLTENRRPASSARTLRQALMPLRSVRVWRFGLYYFLVFGCFVAFSQWLVPYFVNVYYVPLVTAGTFAAIFSFPSGVIRAMGGWMADKWGARRIMYWVLSASCLISLAVAIPKMEVLSPGRGISATRPGMVTAVSADSITVGNDTYALAKKPTTFADLDSELLVLPTKEAWQEPAVIAGQTVQRRELLAKGITRIFFQANIWIFAVLVLLLGAIWGIGMAAVYKYIPDYFPEQVGVVGGMVGVIGGLGGFFGPITFGYLLDATGLWTSCWMFIFVLSVVCLLWLMRTVRRLEARLDPRACQIFEAQGIAV
ncbi:MAG: NarK/NasA family nitrate transporter [Candidatus Schekmanbacteria bacterium]|nr:NarK/NasA family nitrate transporter [Candidatus Schekmanbacteria bacterium]